MITGILSSKNLQIKSEYRCQRYEWVKEPNNDAKNSL